MFFLKGCTHVTREVQLFADRRREERCNLAYVGGGAARAQLGTLPAWLGSAWQGADPVQDDGELAVPSENQTGLCKLTPLRQCRGKSSDKQQSGVSLGMKSEPRQGRCFLSPRMRWKDLWVNIAMLHFGLRCYSVDQCAMSHTQNKSNQHPSKASKAKLTFLLMRRLWFVSPNAMLSQAMEKL